MRSCLLALLTFSAVALGQTPVTVQNNGPIATRIDILILGDGYTSAELGKFSNDVQSTVTTFFAQDPWKSYAKFVNVHRLDIVSAQSGASHPENSVTVNNALGSSYNCSGIQRLICADSSKVNSFLANVPAAQRDIVLILVNDVVYGGSGGSFAVASLNSSSVEIALHEIGHSFALLADEYGGPPPPACTTTSEPSQANATIQTSRATLKWAPWVDAATPLPTTGTKPSTPGIFEGAIYCDNGVYRPTYNSKMRSLGVPYDQINTEQFVRRYYSLAVAPIDSTSPAVATIVIAPSRKEIFTIATAPLDLNTITAAWTLDGSPVATGTSFTLDASTLSVGSHTVAVTAHDGTALVRSDPAGVTSETKQWPVSVVSSCPALTLDSTSASFGVAGGGGSFTVAPSSTCNWQAQTSVSWITFTNPNGGPAGVAVAFQVQSNSGNSRSASIVIGDKTYTVTQAGVPCSVTLDLAAATYPGSGDSSTVNVTAPAGCAWTVSSPVPWITAAAGGVGSQALMVTVAGNTSTASRQATLTVGGQAYIVTQLGIASAITAVVNAASFVNNGGTPNVSPGMLATLFGVDLGPSPLVGLALDVNGRLATSVFGTRVLFDGVAAPIVYVWRLQTSVVVPYAVAGKTTTSIVIEFNGVQSAAFKANVVATVPGIFSAGSNGKGQGAVLNQNNSANTAANAESRGNVLQVYATGEGQTSPAGIDGQLGGATQAHPVLPVTATVGGLPAVVQYAGSAVGLVAGVIQVNVQIPANAPTGSAVPLVISVGGVASQSVITVAVK